MNEYKTIIIQIYIFIERGFSVDRRDLIYIVVIISVQ